MFTDSNSDSEGFKLGPARLRVTRVRPGAPAAGTATGRGRGPWTGTHRWCRMECPQSVTEGRRQAGAEWGRVPSSDGEGTDGGGRVSMLPEEMNRRG